MLSRLSPSIGTGTSSPHDLCARALGPPAPGGSVGAAGRRASGGEGRAGAQPGSSHGRPRTDGVLVPTKAAVKFANVL